MTELQRLQQEYFLTLQDQTIAEEDIDYHVMDRHRPFLEQMAKVKNSGLTVFDIYKNEHIYVSYNLEDLFGYEMDKIESLDTEYFNSRIHPEDMITLLRNGIHLFKYCHQLPLAERQNYKLQNEFRILDRNNQYIRVIEQHVMLELDRRGNYWLVLSVMDLSPFQDPQMGVRSQFINTVTGLPVSFSASDPKTDQRINLTKRESEILSMVKEGYLSKESLSASTR